MAVLLFTNADFIVYMKRKHTVERQLTYNPNRPGYFEDGQAHFTDSLPVDDDANVVLYEVRVKEMAPSHSRV